VEEESSNYKELRNLVDSIGAEARAGQLRDCELLVFTDNSMAESCFHRGTSKSPHLHALVVDLRNLEMIYGMTLHVVHISGKRMIAQGTDGCSRGSLMEGVMAGQDMLSFIDLARSAVERHPPVLEWVRSWTGTLHRPWSFKRAPLLVEMGRDLREVLLKGEGDGGDILRKLLKLPGLVALMSECMACGVLHVPGRSTEVPHGIHRG